MACSTRVLLTGAKVQQLFLSPLDLSSADNQLHGPLVLSSTMKYAELQVYYTTSLLSSNTVEKAYSMRRLPRKLLVTQPVSFIPGIVSKQSVCCQKTQRHLLCERSDRVPRQCHQDLYLSTCVSFAQPKPLFTNPVKNWQGLNASPMFAECREASTAINRRQA